MRSAVPFLLLFTALAFAQDKAEDAGPVKFGTTVVASSWFRGQIYHLHHWATKLPDFRKMRPVGSIYTPVLDVKPTMFSSGFPGVTNRYEFFGIDYTTRFWVGAPGRYRFALLADDGADLYIDDRLVIENDGQHPPLEKLGEVELGPGIHSMHVPYYQGPKYLVALVLKVAGPSEKEFHIFSTEDFKPPPDAKDW